jgi:ABC-type polysaccharide/polyol phosphate transport system ATPase subunit
MTSYLSLRGVGKQYADATLRRRNQDRWSLRGVDLDVHAGEIVAVIGRNGAGKSTLLKVAAGVTHPTEGELHRTRRVAPLIEVGAGFHPDLTGRENVLLNGRLLGMSRSAVRNALDEIVEFAGLEPMIDEPVKAYSSGMFMRLGFAVAIHTNPELLLVDEVLAVGDLPFQLKCLDRITALREDGVGVLFVSHNLAAVSSLATRAVLLDAGQVRATGDTRSVVSAYHDLLAVGDSASQVGSDGALERGLHLVRAEVVDDDGVEVTSLEPGQDVLVRLQLEAREEVGPTLLGCTLHKEGSGMVSSFLAFSGPRVSPFAEGESREVVLGLTLNVSMGNYFLEVGLASEDGSRVHFERQIATLTVSQRPGASGIVDIAPRLVSG